MMSSMKSVTAILGSLVLLAAMSLACGGDDDDDPAATGAAATEAPTEAATSAPGDPTQAPTEAPEPTAEATATTAPEPTQPPPPTEPPPTEAPTQPAGSTDPLPFDPEPNPPTGIYTLTDVRIGAHPEGGGFDRIVFEFDGAGHPGGMVEYVDSAFMCGSGIAVTVAGGAILHVRLDGSQAHDEQGSLTIDDQYVAGPGDAIVEALQFCDFEGLVEWAVGVNGEQPFTVTFLADPARIVIDVQWP